MSSARPSVTVDLMADQADDLTADELDRLAQSLAVDSGLLAGCLGFKHNVRFSSSEWEHSADEQSD